MPRPSLVSLASLAIARVAAGTGALILLSDDKAPPRPKKHAKRAPRQDAAHLRPRLDLGPHSGAGALRLRF